MRHYARSIAYAMQRNRGGFERGLSAFRTMRERGDFRIPQAVRMLTSRAADTFRIADRGRLAGGAHADLLLFDPATAGIGPMKMVRDLPAGQGRLTTPAAGAPDLTAIELESGDQRVRLTGTTEADEMPTFTAQEMPATFPFFRAFAANGWLRMTANGDPVDMAATASGKQGIARFAAFCGG